MAVSSLRTPTGSLRSDPDTDRKPRSSHRHGQEASVVARHGQEASVVARHEEEASVVTTGRNARLALGESRQPAQAEDQRSETPWQCLWRLKARNEAESGTPRDNIGPD